VLTDGRQQRCRPSVNIICGRIMIGLLLSSVSKHNIWSYYDWVVVFVIRQYGRELQPNHIRPLIVFTDEDNDNPIIIPPHIMFTDGRQQRQPNHNTTTYCVYLRKTTTTQSCGRIMIGLSLSSVSKHNMWSCYDWVAVVVFRLLTQYVVIL
jgi:hypothetical protein